jgi:hypothetical protein
MTFPNFRLLHDDLARCQARELSALERVCELKHSLVCVEQLFPQCPRLFQHLEHLAAVG